MNLSFFNSFYNKHLSSHKKFVKELSNILGFTPGKVSLYLLAFTHSSSSSEIGENNERLELLGDSVLNLIITDYLYRKYPYKGEGFLSEMRSKIVSRTQLNTLAYKLGIQNFIDANLSNKSLHKSSTLGNAVEALIGAIYLDKGFVAAEKFTKKKLLLIHLDVETLEQKIVNFKSRIINYVQKNNFEIDYKLLEEKQTAQGKIFLVGVFVNNEEMGRAEDFNKKRAEQSASKLACEKLGLIDME